MNMHRVFICVGIVFGLLMQTKAANPQHPFFEHVKNFYNMHIEQTQRDDRKWDAVAYMKKPVGFYDATQEAANKRSGTAWKICGGSAATAVAASIVFLQTPPSAKNNTEARHPLDYITGPIMVTAATLATGSLIYVGGNRLFAWGAVRGYDPEYIARDSKGNVINEQCEYYKLSAAKGMPQPVITSLPTVVTFPQKNVVK